MLEMVLFHHHSSIYNKDWSKPGFGRVCSNPCYIYYLWAQGCGTVYLPKYVQSPNMIASCVK